MICVVWFAEEDIRTLRSCDRQPLKHGPVVKRAALALQTAHEGYFGGRRAFNSSNQCSTTTMLAGVAFGSLPAMFLTIRNR